MQIYYVNKNVTMKKSNCFISQSDLKGGNQIFNFSGIYEAYNTLIIYSYEIC